MKSVSMSFLVVLCIGLQSMGAQLIFKNNARVSVPSCVLHVPDGDMYEKLSTKGYIVKRDNAVGVYAEESDGDMLTGEIRTETNMSIMRPGTLFLSFSGKATQGLLGQQAHTQTYLNQVFMDTQVNQVDVKNLAYSELKDLTVVGRTQLFNLADLPNCK